jgi:hypothetical protein
MRRRRLARAEALEDARRQEALEASFDADRVDLSIFKSTWRKHVPRPADGPALGGRLEERVIGMRTRECEYLKERMRREHVEPSPQAKRAHQTREDSSRVRRAMTTDRVD